MPELRWTLLILGALFIAGLAIWEFRRQRHARGQSVERGADPRFGEAADEQSRLTASDPFAAGHGASRSESRDGPRVYREPTLTFPDTQPRHDTRDPMAELPVVEIEDRELTGLRVDAETAVDSFSMHADDDDELETAADHPDAGLDELDEKPAHTTPMVPRLTPAEPMIAERRFVPATRGAASDGTPDTTRNTASEAGVAAGAQDFDEGVLGPARVVGEAPAHEPMHVEDPAPAEPAGPVTPFNFDTDAPAITEPIVDWPEDETRKIIALRLVSGGGERFSGRAVRQALAAEGFLLGKFDIFHKPGPDARAVLSAASLTKPGTFTLSNMDLQRFGGLSLFAVLPGPLSPTATFDELLITARSLNDRLRGALQDERGEPLTPVRSASIRESLTAQATAAAPVVGPASGAAPAAESDTNPN